MRIAILIRMPEGLSLIRYRENLMRELLIEGVSILPFYEHEEIPPQCDMVWDPGMGRNRHPLPNLKKLNRPVVITLHGSATFTMKWHEVYTDWQEAIRDKWANVGAMKEWAWFKNKVDAVIAVSQYGAREASQVYDIPSRRITPIYHGVDHTMFFPEENTSDHIEPYLLHVSVYQPVKNLTRLVQAYAQLPIATRPKLVIVSPGFNINHRVTGLTIVAHPLNSTELAKLYNQALGFIFPSLRESFGLPIIEAMACGCPVITSFDTACAEIAGNAALLVNPRSVCEIKQAMSRLINEPELRAELRQKGIMRASLFTWAKTARLHLDVFRTTCAKHI